MTSEACKGFQVFPQELCFNLNYNEWALLFEAAKTDLVMERLKDSIVIHYWTSLSKHLKLNSQIRNAFTEYGNQFCPKVMDSIGEFIS